MERLTHRVGKRITEYCDKAHCEYCDKDGNCTAFEPTGTYIITPKGNEVSRVCMDAFLERLADLEDKIESGKLVELPRILKWLADPKSCQVLFVEDKHICLTETMTEAQAEALLKELQEKRK